MEGPEVCYGPGSVAGSVLGTFLATCLCLALGLLLYRKWRRNKGKHLVLVTDPEIVEEAYAFDNPCFKDTTPAVSRSLERPASMALHSETTPKEATAARWLTPWSNRNDKRRTLDDSCLGPKAARVSVVGLRSRDFTGLGFNVCGNMREGIFVKDLLHRGPASESGRIHPGDRIISVKISFRSMVYEDALTILSYASPYDVELEVESGGGSGSKPTTLLKKTVGPSPTRICHPLYRSQSIPDLRQQLHSGGRKHANSSATCKRLFAAQDPNDSSYSNYSTVSSTLKSSKSTPSSLTLERRNEDLRANHHHHHLQQPKFGIKVLPALDSQIHRIETQNEHNTNLERRHSKKLEFAEKRISGEDGVRDEVNGRLASESLQQRSVTAKKLIPVDVIHDVTDRAAQLVQETEGSPRSGIPSEVPAEVHNAAMAARRNRKSSNLELMDVPKMLQQAVDPQQMDSTQEAPESADGKSPQKGKRKAPAPPSRSASEISNDDRTIPNEKLINGVSHDKGADESATESMNESSTTKSTLLKDLDEQTNDKTNVESKVHQGNKRRIIPSDRRNSESDTDSEIQNNFTTIELNSADVLVHHTPVPDVAAKNDDDEDAEDDVYRKAASLGDLSKYENKSSTTLERAQSLDMTDTGSKKRKAPMPPPEDIHESTEDLSKLDQMESFDRRKLKKSSEWGTLEDAIWNNPGTEALDESASRAKNKSTSNGNGTGTLERSKSNVEVKTTKGEVEKDVSADPVNVSDGAIETSLELYNLPLSKKLTQDFIRSERLFDPEEDNALARLVNDGRIVKSPTPEQLEEDFRKAHPPPVDAEDELPGVVHVSKKSPEVSESFEKAIRYFDAHAGNSTPPSSETKVSLPEAPEDLYRGKKEVVEEPMTKVTLNFYCPGCNRHGHHSDTCSKRLADHEEPADVSYHQTIRVQDASSDTHFAKPILSVPDDGRPEDDEDEAAYEFGSTVTVTNKNLASSPIGDKHNVSNVSVSSGENSEDSGLVRESIEYTPGSEPLPASPSSSSFLPQKMTYVTEIKVSPGAEEINDDDNTLSDNEEIVSIMEGSKKPGAEAAGSTAVTLNVTANGKLPAGKKPPVPPRRSDAARFIPRSAGDEKQIVYVSEYKSPAKEDKRFENKIFLKDAGEDKQQEINPWGNGSSPAQPSVTNIVFSSPSSDEIARK